MTNERVLILDHADQNIAFLTKTILNPAGYQPLVAQDGQTGLALARSEQPEVILLALDLLVEEGLAFIDSLQAAAINCPIILMADAQDNPAVIVQALQRGGAAYAPRPFDSEQVRQTLEKALVETRLRKERDELARQLHAAQDAEAERMKELITLFGVGKSVTTVWRQDRLLTRLVEAAIFLTHAEQGSLMLVDEASGELYMAAARGMDERVARSFRLPVEDSLAGEVVRTGQPLIFSSQELTKIKTAYLVRSLLYVPLKLKGRVSGVLAVDNRHQARDFTNHDLRLLSALADYAAISLENAGLLKRVAQEQLKLSTVLSEIESPVLILGLENDLVAAANQAFGSAFGLDAQTVIGQPLSDWVSEPALLEFLAEASPDSDGYRGEMALTNGRIFWVTLTHVPETGRLLVMTEITHFKEFDQRKSEFIATISHELRAPLVSAREYAELLHKTGDLNNKQTLFVERIAHCVNQLTALIDHLLELHRLELEIDPAETLVDLSQLTAKVVANFQPQAQRNHHQLIYHTPAESVPVYGNPIKLEQVVTNLIDNALKYTPPAGQIEAFVQVQNQRVIFKLADSGQGIAAREVPFIFDKFFRGRSGNANHNNHSVGLGLSICKAVVKKYGGQIWVDSQPGQGSVFTVILPLASTDDPLTDVVQDVEARI